MLGDDDPFEAQQETPGLLRELVATAGSSLLVRPAPDEWSALECIGHITDGELVSAGRYRWILAHERPPLLPYDQDLWVGALRHGEANPEDLLGLFESIRASNLLLWRQTPEADRSRLGIHQERGPESYELTFRLIAGHDRLHFRQARLAVEQAASART
jgi:hypothetical protein